MILLQCQGRVRGNNLSRSRLMTLNVKQNVFYNYAQRYFRTTKTTHLFIRLGIICEV